MLLDEFAALGRLDPVGRAFALMVSHGIQLLPILRDLQQLRRLYGERPGTFHSKRRPGADIQRCRYRHGELKLQFSRTTDRVLRRDLITPDEAMRLYARREILMRQGGAAVIAQKVGTMPMRSSGGRVS